MEIIKNENEILSYWESSKTDQKVRDLRSKGKKFYFLDGPPYVTGELGTHHVWVETIKDLVVRYRRYRGFNVHDRAGFDVHGLPIEFKVEKLLNTTSKSDIEVRIGIDKFVAECRNYAKIQAKSAISTFVRFGSSLDFQNVYMPYENSYIEKGWQIFKEMHKKGLLYKELQPLGYCPRCETVLSAQGPEVEYEDETDPSIFVKFRVDKAKSKNSKLIMDKGETYLVVWTTTPWTLPANIAIAANPKELYLTLGAEGKNYIVAKGRAEDFTKLTGMSTVAISEFYGSELDGIRFVTPLENEVPHQAGLSKYHRVILSEGFVSVGDGTGLLHVAPGHGLEDYRLGKENRLPIFSPVDEKARFTDQAGKFQGLKVPKEANEAVLSALKDSGNLLFDGTIRHSYPHCWRCHSKLITRSTEQWFIKVQKIKKRMLRENEKVVWHPKESSGWFADAVESSPDWCVSRQRYWGAPLPIWICGSCKSIDVIGSLEELKEKGNLEKVPYDLHRPYVDMIKFKCSCGGQKERVKDIFDVWYDSGISHTASLKDGEFERLFPADWITESRDQIRGWFTMLLRTSVAVYGKTPFKRVNIGGMLKDELGQDMHRHLGNTVSANNLLEIVSADGFRLWCSSHPRWLELKLKKNELEEADSNIMTLYNVSQLVKEFGLLANIDIKEVVKPPAASRLTLEETWILSRLNSLIASVTEELDDYRVDEAVKEIREFILEDLSRFYLKFAKQRAESAGKPELKRIASLNAYIMRKVAVLASPIIPFATEHIYRDLFSKENGSIFMEDWPKASKRLVDPELEDEFGLLKEIGKAALYLREKSNSKLRWPIKEIIIETSDQRVISALARIGPLIEMYVNSKSIRLIEGKKARKEVKPAFAKIGPSFKAHASAVAKELASADADQAIGSIDKLGYHRIHTNEGDFDIKPEHFTVVESAREGDGASVRSMGFDIYVRIDPEITEEMKSEIFARELIRRVQMMRKEMGLTRVNRVVVYFKADAQIAKLIEAGGEQIKQTVKADSIWVNAEIPPESFRKEWGILNSDVEIAVLKK